MLTRLRRTSLYARLSRHQVVMQFVRYAMVGAVNVVVYFGLFNLLRVLAVQRNLAAAIAFVVTSLQSFALNKLWTFKDRSTHWVVRQYLLFLAMTLIGLAIQQAVFKLLLIPLEQFGRIGENAALVGTLPFSIAWNFFSYRRWTFRERSSPVRASVS